ncbi:MAG: S41 family peptidase [Pirellulaceae bacterium]
MTIRNIHILLLITVVCFACYIQADRLRYAGKIGSALDLIDENFIDEVDSEELYIAAMNGMVSKLDRFSEFIPPARYDDFQSMIEQQFGGLGVLIEGPPVSKQLTVVAPIPGTPAFEAGILPGDVIAEIEDQSTEGISATDAKQLMRGPVGEPIRLLVRRDKSEPIEMRIRRADILVDSVYGDRICGDSSWDFFLEEDPRIAYIRITQFGERTLGEFETALTTIQPQAQAIVIDLRFNPGGILPTTVKLCDMLVDHGIIVSTKGRRKDFGVEFKATPSVKLDPSIPIVVMVNEQSASASEIMAGCLQDLGRAKIAGTRSYGKGTVQQVFPLDNDTAALKFTTARFYRPSGKNIHRTDEMTEADQWGVSPDPELQFGATTDNLALSLNLRWQRNGDPRITAAYERPPSPPFAGDEQLGQVAEYLQSLLANPTP